MRYVFFEINITIRGVRLLRNQYRRNVKNMLDIQKGIKNDADESSYGLEQYDDELKEIAAEISRVTEEEKQALNTFETETAVQITAEITGLPQTGFFGFHIHEGKSCGGTKFSETGSHYNPQNTAHPEHAGDLPPLLWCRGNAYLSVRTDRFSVIDIIGRTVVIHSDPDDFHTQPAGNAGKKIACGVIRKRR